MRIIRPGVIPAPDKSVPYWLWVVFTCDNCDCKFQLESTDPEPSFGKHGWVDRCPTCGSYTAYLYPNRLVKWWLRTRND